MSETVENKGKWGKVNIFVRYRFFRFYFANKLVNRQRSKIKFIESNEKMKVTASNKKIL